MRLPCSRPASSSCVGGRERVGNARGAAPAGALVARHHEAVAGREVELRRERLAGRIVGGERERVAVVDERLVDAEHDVARRMEVDAVTTGQRDRAVGIRIRGAAGEQRRVARCGRNAGEPGDDGPLCAEFASGAREPAEQLDAHTLRPRDQSVGSELVTETARRLERTDGLRGRRSRPDPVSRRNVQVHDSAPESDRRDADKALDAGARCCSKCIRR